MRFTLRTAAPIFVLIAIAATMVRDYLDAMPLLSEPYTPEKLEAKLARGSPVLGDRVWELDAFDTNE